MALGPRQAVPVGQVMVSVCKCVAWDRCVKQLLHNVCDTLLPSPASVLLPASIAKEWESFCCMYCSDLHALLHKAHTDAGFEL
jgi:hypothetical protein